MPLITGIARYAISGRASQHNFIEWFGKSRIAVFSIRLWR